MRNKEIERKVDQQKRRREEASEKRKLNQKNY